MLSSLLLIAFSDSTQISFIIKKLTPSVSQKTATNIAKIIETNSIKYNIDWKIPVTIFKQESNFRVNRINNNYRDFGIGQMNWRTIKHRNLDLVRLLSEDRYAIEETFKMLKDLKNKYGKREKTWYTRYHSFISSHRAKYLELLNKHAKIIDEALK